MAYKIKFGSEYRRQLGPAPTQKFPTFHRAYEYGLGRYGSANYNLQVFGKFVGWTVVEA